VVLLLYFILTVVVCLFPAPVMSRFITSAEDFSASKDVDFSWTHARSRSVKILLEYLDKDNAWQRVNLGSGFLLSSDGLFVTAYHVMKFCLEAKRGDRGLSVNVDCSNARPHVRYVAINEEREFPIEVIAHLKEADSTNGKAKHTPDEIIKQRDFVVGKLKTDGAATFPYWRLKDFDQENIDTDNPDADFSLTPLMPPKRVFIAGFPNSHDFVISEGFLNLTEEHRRGYFAADLKVYSAAYLQSQNVAVDTQWGMRIENHMSGGAVIDAAGHIVGMVVNGNQNTAGVLSIENIVATFFSREGGSGARPAILLNPTETPLFLKQEKPNIPESDDEDPLPVLISRGATYEFSLPQDPQATRQFITIVQQPR
jgi:hypothetical protein